MSQRVHVAVIERRAPQPPVSPVITDEAVCNDERRKADGSLGGTQQKQTGIGSINYRWMR
eukprot:3679050-Prymnesium_polylepis.2